MLNMLYSSLVFAEITFVSCSQVLLCTGDGCTDNDTNILHYKHIALAVLTGFLFATRLPERLAPGSFDYIGEIPPLRHSHWFQALIIQVRSLQINLLPCKLIQILSNLMNSQPNKGKVRIRHKLSVRFDNLEKTFENRYK